MKYKLKTYTTWYHFEDDSEDAESELIDEDFFEYDRLVDLFKDLKNVGYLEPSSSPEFHRDVWYSSTNNETNRTIRLGGSEETTYHLDRSTPLKAQKALWNALIDAKVLSRSHKKVRIS